MTKHRSVELKIDHHSSGRYTLKQRERIDTPFRDCMSESDASAFLEAFYGELKGLMDSGVEVKLGPFPDTTTNELD